MQLASYWMREINKKSDRFKKRYQNFLRRINGKLNEGKIVDFAEEQELKSIYERATEPARLKW